MSCYLLKRCALGVHERIKTDGVISQGMSRLLQRVKGFQFTSIIITWKRATGTLFKTFPFVPQKRVAQSGLERE